MKRIFLIFLLLIIAVPCFGGQPLKRHLEPETVNYFSLPSSSGDQFTLNEQIKLIKYNGGSVTLSGLTANFSNATGYQFVTNPSVDLRKWIGYYITFTSSVGNTLKVKASAAGTGENKTTIYTSDFSAGVDGFIASGGTVDGNIDGIGGEDNVIRFTINANNSVHYLIRSTVISAYRASKITYKYYIPSGQSNIDGIKIRSGGIYYGDFQTVTDTWTTVTITIVSTGTDIRFHGFDGSAPSFQDAGGDDVFYIKDVVIENYTSPSATGIYFTDPVVTGTFDYNAASYTAVITKD